METEGNLQYDDRCVCGIHGEKEDRQQGYFDVARRVDPRRDLDFCQHFPDAGFHAAYLSGIDINSPCQCYVFCGRQREQSGKFFGKVHNHSPRVAIIPCITGHGKQMSI